MRPRFLLLLIVIFSLPSCSESDRVAEVCDNGIDDDMDGFVDCTDIDCGDFVAVDGIHYVGRLSLNGYPNVEWQEQLVFLTNQFDQLILTSLTTGSQHLLPAHRVAGSNIWEFGGGHEDLWTIAGGQLIDVDYDGITFALTSCDSLTITYTGVSVENSNVAALNGETFPLTDMEIVTMASFL